MADPSVDNSTTGTDAAAQIMSAMGNADPGGGTPPEMLTPRGVSDAGTAPPQQAPQQTPQDAAQGDPELTAAGVHHLRLGHSLMTAANAIGDLLGGTSKMTITKDKDGNMQLTKEPISGGEKWGRIAAGLIAGAAKGFAAGQGPGGAAKALGAGFDEGQRQVQQRQAQPEHELEVAQKLQTFNANMAKTHMDLATSAFNLKAGEIKLAEEQATKFTELGNWMKSGSGNVKVQHVATPQEAMNLAKAPGMLNGHTGTDTSPSNLMFVPTFDGNNKATGFDVWQADPAWMEQKAPAGSYVAPKMVDGTLTFVNEPIPAGAETNGARMLRESKTGVEGMQSLIKTQAKPKSLYDSYEKALAAANGETDPAKKKELIDLSNTLYEKEKGLRIAGRAQAGAGAGGAGYQPGQDLVGAQWGAGDPKSPFEITSAKLAHGDALLSELPSRTGKGMPTRQDYIGRADQIDRAEGGAGYSPVLSEQENKFAGDKKVQAAIDGIDRIIRPKGQFDQLLTLADSAGLDYAAPINAASLKFNKWMGDDGAKNFLTGLEETRRSIAGLMGNPLLGGSETDKKLEQAQEMLGQNPTLENIHSARDVLVQALATQRSAMVDNNRFLRKRYGRTGDQAPTPPNPATAAKLYTGAPPPANLLSTDQVTAFEGKGNWRLINGKPTQTDNLGNPLKPQ